MSSPITTVDPATGRTLATYDTFGEAEIDAALGGAHAAYVAWALVPVSERTELLRIVGKLLTERREEYAALITAEMGKPLAEALAEVDKCAWNCDIVADAAPGWLADHEVASGAARSWLSYEPLGVVFAVMPWNYPFWQVLRFASAALVAGNAGVLKHSPNVTGCALAIEEVLHEAGVPRNLFRTLLLPSSEVKALIEDDHVAAVTLTGSVAAGKSVATAAGGVLKKCVLELGGSDAYVVLEDADIPAAAKVCATARMVNGGQSCIAGKRFIVVRSVLEKFEAALVDAMSAYEILLSDEYQTILAGNGLIPAKTSLFQEVDQKTSIGKAAVEAAANAKLTPASPKWADVESQKLLQTAFTNIASGDDVKAVAEQLDADIEAILNS